MSRTKMGSGGKKKLGKNKRTPAQLAKTGRQPDRTIANRVRKASKHAKRHPTTTRSLVGATHRTSLKMETFVQVKRFLVL